MVHSHFLIRSGNKISDCRDTLSEAQQRALHLARANPRTEVAIFQLISIQRTKEPEPPEVENLDLVDYLRRSQEQNEAEDE